LKSFRYVIKIIVGNFNFVDQIAGGDR